jgi:hypothetical protein
LISTQPLSSGHWLHLATDDVVALLHEIIVSGRDLPGVST